MPNTQKSHMINRLPLTGAALKKPLDLAQTGMPAADSIHDVTDVKPKAGRPAFQIVHTVEVDAYEKTSPAINMAKLLRTTKAPSAAAVASALKAKPPKGDNYVGKDRKAAKLSKANAKLEKFTDLKKLIESLTKQAVMVNHKPKITTAPTSGRVKEEERNVSVKAFLYAASQEADGDYHLVFGRDPSLTPEMYMTAEVSGLPPKNDPKFDFKDLSAARKAFKDYFRANLPGTTYDFYRPPRPVQIEGSLFWDASHAQGTRPGPQSLKSRMPVIWEIHPITSIKLG
jgi:hypothetical protein